MHKHTHNPYIWIMHTLVHIHSNLTYTSHTHSPYTHIHSDTLHSHAHPLFTQSHIYLKYSHMRLIHTHPSPSPYSHIHTYPCLLPSFSCFLPTVGFCPILFVFDSLCVMWFLNLFPDILVAFQDGDHVFNPPRLTGSLCHLFLPPHVHLIHSPLIASADLPRNVPGEALVSPLSWYATLYDHSWLSQTWWLPALELWPICVA